MSDSIFTRRMRKKEYELNDHLENVRIRVSDLKRTSVPGSAPFMVDQRGYENYYPFGMLQPNRGATLQGLTPRYGFNGKEFDNEINNRNGAAGQNGGGNSYDYGFRMYNPRLGRFLSEDPLAGKLPGSSPYEYCLNSPVWMLDIDGRFPYTFYVRAFIPTATDGGGLYRGDNRGFTTRTGKNVTSRLHQAVTVDTDKGAITYRRAWCSPSMIYVRNFMPPVSQFGIERTADPKVEFYNLYINKTLHGKTEYSFTAQATAADPLAFGLAPDIDYVSAFAFVEDKDAGELSIYADVTGEDYPAVEAFVQDRSGTVVFIDARPATGSILGDYGGAVDGVLYASDLRISIDSNGNFQSVSYQGKKYTISDWNKRFEQKPAKE